MNRRWTGVIGLLLLSAAGAGAHGLTVDTVAGGVGIQAAYGDGSPMAVAGVTVYAPLETNTVFQHGMTDRFGRFAFIPNTSGVWRVEVADGMGHRAEHPIPISDRATPSPPPARTPVRAPTMQNAIVGICILFGMFGCWALFAASKRP